jgi:hypothetical protein
VEWSQPDRLERFRALFRTGSRLELAFPEGDEPSWRVPLDGSNAAARFFSECLIALRPSCPTQPFGALPGERL